MAGDDPKELLFLCALQNAVKHGGVPQSGAVIGMVMGAHPELRSRAKEVSALAKEAIADVAALSPDERVATLQARAPEMYAALSEKHEHKKVLPDLEGCRERGRHAVCPQPLRPAPYRACPGCGPQRCLREAVRRAVYPAHRGYRSQAGRSRSVRDGGEDLEWLGLGITETVTQSDRLPLYYDLCRQLIERGGAYVCTCDNEHFKELKQAKTACPCRDQTVEKNLELWEKMLDHTFREGEVIGPDQDRSQPPRPGNAGLPGVPDPRCPASPEGEGTCLPADELLGRCRRPPARRDARDPGQGPYREHPPAALHLRPFRLEGAGVPALRQDGDRRGRALDLPDAPWDQ